MNQYFDEGVAGAGLAVGFSTLGGCVLRLTGLDGHLLLNGAMTLALASLGAVAGAWMARRAARLPPAEHAADYADTVPGH